MNQKKKFQKKKDRERAVRKKLLSDRERRNNPEEATSTEMEESSIFEKGRAGFAPTKEETKSSKWKPPVPKKRKGFTIRNDEMRAAQEAHRLAVQMQLEHNMQILKALEEEYQEELKKRQDYVEGMKTSSLVEKATDYIERNAQTVIENKKK